MLTATKEINNAFKNGVIPLQITLFKIIQKDF